jgi:hypothetical protein
MSRGCFLYEYKYKIGLVVFFVLETRVFTSFHGWREMAIYSVFPTFEEIEIRGL